jgi:hypothetical protein
MAFDLWGALKRAVTLSKSMNSLSDVLGADRTALMRELAAPLVDEVVDEAMGFIGAGLGGVTAIAERATKILVKTAEKLLGHVIAERTEAEMRTAIHDALRGVDPDREVVSQALRRGLFEALKLGGG